MTTISVSVSDSVDVQEYFDSSVFGKGVFGQLIFANGFPITIAPHISDSVVSAESDAFGITGTISELQAVTESPTFTVTATLEDSFTTTEEQSMKIAGTLQDICDVFCYPDVGVFGTGVFGELVFGTSYPFELTATIPDEPEVDESESFKHTMEETEVATFDDDPSFTLHPPIQSDSSLITDSSRQILVITETDSGWIYDYPTVGVFDVGLFGQITFGTSYPITVIPRIQDPVECVETESFYYTTSIIESPSLDDDPHFVLTFQTSETASFDDLVTVLFYEVHLINSYIWFEERLVIGSEIFGLDEIIDLESELRR